MWGCFADHHGWGPWPPCPGLLVLRNSPATLAFVDAWGAAMEAGEEALDVHAFNDLVKQGWQAPPARTWSNDSIVQWTGGGGGAAGAPVGTAAEVTAALEQVASAAAAAAAGQNAPLPGEGGAATAGAAAATAAVADAGAAGAQQAAGRVRALLRALPGAGGVSAGSSVNRAARSVPQPAPPPLPPERLLPAWGGRVALGVLSITVFPSGHVYFVQRLHELCRVPPLVVRTTHTYGGVRSKVHRLRDAGLFDDGAPYYLGPK